MNDTADDSKATTPVGGGDERPGQHESESAETIPDGRGPAAASAEAVASPSASGPEETVSREEGVSEPDPELEERVVTVLKTVYDPEIPVDIHELGLVYDVRASRDGLVRVTFTLTSPNCPAAQSLPIEMERKIKALDGVREARLDLTWDPPWTPEKMSEAAKLKLNMF